MTQEEDNVEEGEPRVHRHLNNEMQRYVRWQCVCVCVCVCVCLRERARVSVLCVSVCVLNRAVLEHSVFASALTRE